MIKARPHVKKSGLLALAIFAPALIGAVVLAGASCSSNWSLSSAKTERFVVSQPIERIVVEHGGDVELIATETTSTMKIERETRYASDPPKPTWAVDGGVLRLDSGCQGRNRCETGYRIELPAGAAPELVTDAGDVTLRGSFERAVVQTGDGKVVGTDLEASVAEVSTDDGDVRLTFAAPIGRVTARSGDGKIDLRGPVGEAVVGTDAGDVSVRLSGAVRSVTAATGDGEIALYGPVGEADLHTDAGDITGVDLRAAIADASTGDGNVRLEFSTAVRRVAAATGAGDIDLALRAAERPGGDRREKR